MRRHPIDEPSNAFHPGAPFERVEVFASRDPRACRERTLVLRAKGIPHVQVLRGREHAILVDASHAQLAASELAAYGEENADWPPRDTVLPKAPLAGVSTALYAVFLGAFFLLSSAPELADRWHASGVARATRIRDGEVWRAVTSLFLHADPVHLANNLVFGALFGYSVAYVLGGGLGWFLVLVAGALGNLTNAYVQDPTHGSLGASTAVFAAVGLLGGSEWKRRLLFGQRRIRIAAPLVMALVILAFHGVPEVPDGVDVMAHVLGFAWGLAIGAALPTKFVQRATVGPRPAIEQKVAAILSVLLILSSWSLALLRSV